MAVFLFLAFLIGALTVVAVELLILWIVIRRLNRKGGRRSFKENDVSSADMPRDLSAASFSDKQGFLWILEADKVAASIHQDKAPTERRRKREIFEVTPVRKYAKLNDRCLTLQERDGSFAEISLVGCTVVAVSASNLPSSKWAKRYPIKVESNDSVVYKGSKSFYIYLETSWEKEAWCKALRLSSADNDEKLIWFSELTRDFQNYLASLSSGYPSYVMPSTDPNFESKEDKSVKVDNTSSKIRQFLKKLAKKSFKTGNEYKSGEIFAPGDDGKVIEKSFSFHHSLFDTDLRNADTKGKPPTIVSDESSLVSSNSNNLETKRLTSEVSAVDPRSKVLNQGALCLNMLVSRLFFDVKNNKQILAYIQSRIQRTLSNMRVPSYIGEVVCNGVNPGNLPPHILSMRVLPSDLSEVWSLEVSFEYLDGFALDIETWLGVQELELEGENTSLGTNSGREVTSYLLEGIEHFEEQLSHSEVNTGETVKDERYLHSEVPEKGNDDGSAPSRWKSMVHSIAKQVSQVPLSMRIGASSLRGTLHLSLKPPPSDQIWFGFASMPDIEFNVKTSVGDYKITSGRVSQFMINRIKVAIRETLVLPNYESLAISWMLSEKDDWVPRSIAPYVWYRSNESSNIDMPKPEPASIEPATIAPTVEAKEASSSRTEVFKNQKLEISSSIPTTNAKPVEKFTLESNPVNKSVMDGSSVQELRVPLLNKDTIPETSTRNIDDTPLDDESRQRRIGTRERMRGLGKKMGEKLDVKRRNFKRKEEAFWRRCEDRENASVYSVFIDHPSKIDLF